MKNNKMQEVSVQESAQVQVQESAQVQVQEVEKVQVKKEIQKLIATFSKEKFRELEALMKEIEKIKSPLTEELLVNLEAQKTTIESRITEEEILPNVPYIGTVVNLIWSEDTKKYKVTIGMPKRIRNVNGGNGNIPHWTSYNYPFTAQSVCDKLGIPVGSASANAVLWGKAGRTVEGVRKLVDQAMTPTTTQ